MKLCFFAIAISALSACGPATIEDEKPRKNLNLTDLERYQLGETREFTLKVQNARAVVVEGLQFVGEKRFQFNLKSDVRVNLTEDSFMPEARCGKSVGPDIYLYDKVKSAIQVLSSYAYQTSISAGNYELVVRTYAENRCQASVKLKIEEWVE